MLLDFFYDLRRHGLKVGLQEWHVLLEALCKGLHESQLTSFYHLARAILVHSEADFDAFDQAFASTFQGIESESLVLHEALAEWLQEAAQLKYLSPEERAAMQALDLDELRRLLAERLAEQKKRHEGGNRFIGTGGTSPFGHSGYHPSGLRIGGEGGSRSAAQLAEERRFREYRRDLILDVRQIKVALRGLRDLRREGSRDELDLEATVDRTSKNAGELEICWRAPRRNNLKVLLLMDVGGSMSPHAQVVGQLFSAAAQSKHFRDFHAYYFHNCVYDQVYEDAFFTRPLPLLELFARYGSRYKLVLVGDAMMHPMELLHEGGALNFWYRNAAPGIERLDQLASHFERAAWLNPERPRFWTHTTVHAIRRVFEMFPLTLDGLGRAVDHLVRARNRTI
ncbi:MAG: VWA domain-containing protein [Deltaproteobacteria bacterium]|nr:VWA domain-containing protein [Deltaproteobacteria bacterium]